MWNKGNSGVNPRPWAIQSSTNKFQMLQSSFLCYTWKHIPWVYDFMCAGRWGRKTKRKKTKTKTKSQVQAILGDAPVKCASDMQVRKNWHTKRKSCNLHRVVERFICVSIKKKKKNWRSIMQLWMDGWMDGCGWVGRETDKGCLKRTKTWINCPSRLFFEDEK